jgi:hypothetical protein
MFDDHWRISYWSQDSAGKRTIKTPYFGRSENSRKIPEKYQKITFYQKTEEARRRSREEPQGRHTHRGRGLAPGRAGLLCGHPGPLLSSPLRVFHRPRKPKSREGSEIDTAASAGRKTPEREKLSGGQESAREIPSRRGEIVAIVIIIAPDFIEIIITIILITSTFISTITSPSRCNILS